MKGVDLSLFRFDYDLTFFVFFMNAHQHVLGRYGSRDAKAADGRLSTQSLAAAMRRALEAHAQAKDTKPPPRAAPLTVEELPHFKRLQAKGQKAPQCFHCHHAGNWQREEAIVQRAFDKQKDVWIWPLPENVGLVPEKQDGARLARVVAGSPASRAGLQAGDEVLAIGGQSVSSEADLQWTLHHAKPGDKLELAVRRAGKAQGATLELPRDEAWRKSDVSWRSSMWVVEPRLQFWAPELPAARRSKLGLPADRLALEVKWVPPGHARDAGLRNGDVIVAADGDRRRLTPPQLHQKVALGKELGDVLELVVLRGGKEVTLRLKLRAANP